MDTSFSAKFRRLLQVTSVTTVRRAFQSRMTLGEFVLDRRSKLWLAMVGCLLAIMILPALFLPRSFGLAAFSDITQCLLLFSGAAAFVPLALRSHGRVRLFWSLIILGVGFWLSYQLYWTYHEVLLRSEVPDLCAWDVVLFLHIVPLMAALAVR